MKATGFDFLWLSLVGSAVSSNPSKALRVEQLMRHAGWRQDREKNVEPPEGAVAADAEHFAAQGEAVESFGVAPNFVTLVLVRMACMMFL